jgi:translation initiation factor IF-2
MKPNATSTPRPPVTVIMGHIDHGKSTLLDYIRKTNLTEKEAGGITQHLGAYQVLHKDAEGKDRAITFLDTPGHEAFKGIRSRGASVADVAILVVSAEDGVKPQTLEALGVIKTAGIPYIVAMNKIDRPGANVERTKQGLAENEIYVEGYGGDITAVPISALKGTGVSDLLDMIILTAEVADLKGNPSHAATGHVIEANLDTKKGVSATLIVKDGTLKQGSFIVAGNAVAPVRMMLDALGKPLTEAGLSVPAKVIGWNKMPKAGLTFKAYDNKRDAEEAALLWKDVSAADKSKAQAEEAGDRIIVPVVVKADVVGSLEGIRHELAKLKTERVIPKIIHEGVGDIAESDLKAASGAPGVLVMGFHVKTDSKAKAAAERLGIEILNFDIIYKLAEHVAAVMAARTPKVMVEEATGTAKIIRVFSKAKDKQILGGKVQQGAINVGSEVKILRRDVEVGFGKIRELQSQKVKTSEVAEGFEFGTMVESKVEIAEGDKIQAFRTVEK